MTFFRYMVAKASRENSGGGDGIETIKNEPFEKDGRKGQYTLKVCCKLLFFYYLRFYK